MGYPVLNVDNMKNITQKRFLLDSRANSSEPHSAFGYDSIMHFRGNLMEILAIHLELVLWYLIHKHSVFMEIKTFRNSSVISGFKMVD